MRIKIGRGTMDDEQTVGYLTHEGAEAEPRIEGDEQTLRGILARKRADQTYHDYLAELPLRLRSPHLWAVRIR